MRVIIRLKLLFFSVVCGKMLFAALPSFNHFLENIVQKNPTMNEARSQLDARRARNQPNGALLFMPTLELEALGYHENEFGILNKKYGFGATSKINLFRFGADWNTMRAASFSVSAEENNYKGKLLEVEQDAVLAIADYIRYSQQVTVLKHLTVLRENFQKIGNEQNAKGLLAKPETEKLVLDTFNSRGRLTDAEMDLARAESALKARTTLAINDLKVEWPWKDFFVKQVTKLSQFKVEELSKRPDWRKAKALSESASLGSRSAWANIFPTLDLVGSYGYYSSTRGPLQLTGGEYFAGVSLKIPLFDRLINYSEYSAQVHEADAAEARFSLVKRNALTEWEGNQKAVAKLLSQVKERDTAALLANKIYEGSMERFRNGLTNTTNIRVDFERLYDAEMLSISGWANLHISFATLCHATGKRLSDCLN